MFTKKGNTNYFQMSLIITRTLRRIFILFTSMVAFSLLKLAVLEQGQVERLQQREEEKVGIGDEKMIKSAKFEEKILFIIVKMIVRRHLLLSHMFSGLTIGPRDSGCQDSSDSSFIVFMVCILFSSVQYWMY